MKFLIVDDNAAIRSVMRAVLADPQNEFLECDDGGKAVDCYQEYRPDWVLMDIVMPGVDGLEATRRILRTDSAAHVVFMTLYDDPDLRAAALGTGAAGYFRKEDLLALKAFCLRTETP